MDKLIQIEEPRPRCIGACCRAFNLSLTREQVRGVADADAGFVADMLVPLRTFEARETWGDLARYAGQRHGSEDVLGHAEYVYTCKHLDEKRACGGCAVYDTRPKMCSAFPYTRKCLYEGCDVGRGTEGVEDELAAYLRQERVGRISPEMWARLRRSFKGWSRKARAARTAVDTCAKAGLRNPAASQRADYERLFKVAINAARSNHERLRSRR